MRYLLNIEDFKEKDIWDLGKEFAGKSKDGEEISFTNYYMCKNGHPFFGISGEFHFSRMDDSYWEDEIIKMKMCGINVIATYVFWNHHEEEEGNFDFSGRKNVRKFIELCWKHGIYVIIRVGPFAHGEVRNGGIPDWMYGKPFEVRQLNEGFLYYTKRLYTKIAEEIQGLFFEDGGPVIAAQIDNEYMHSSAPWEITTGVSNEWVFGGNEGDTYMLELKKLAAECGIRPAFYTCTGWGGASTPESMMPLWGGYAFRPWLFYSYQGEHPSTEEYVYQDFHNNTIPCTNDFQPKYQPEEKPYACCEMGGGMTCSYNYRFILPYKSVDAMANIKMASGCNFLGYYVFQGGSNPLGKHGIFMNEGQVPKISYDYQAALGEYGQVRESYLRLKAIHYLASAFGEKLCGLKTILPEGASDIEPKDMKTLRYAVRTDGRHGFLFINNYQDHETMPEREGEEIEILLSDRAVTFKGVSIAGDENAILPFYFDMHGIELVWATAQPVTYLEEKNRTTYVFMRPDGMMPVFQFEEGVKINGEPVSQYIISKKESEDVFSVEKDSRELRIICVNRSLANQMYIWENKGFIFSEGAVLIEEDSVRIETQNPKVRLHTYPDGLLEDSVSLTRMSGSEIHTCFGYYEACIDEKRIEPELSQVGPSRYILTFQNQFMLGVKDAILGIRYTGDIGHAFIDGRMISDNFCNGDVWEIGLKTFAEQLEEKPLTIYITPLKEGVNVNVESSMAARMEEVSAAIGTIDEIKVSPVYEIRII